MGLFSGTIPFPQMVWPAFGRYELYDPTQIREFLKDRYDRIRNESWPRNGKKNRKRSFPLKRLTITGTYGMNNELSQAEARHLKIKIA